MKTGKELFFRSVHIARGIYIPYNLEAVVSRLTIAFDRGYLARACIQTALYDSWWQDTVYLIKMIRQRSHIPISLSVFPVSDRHLEILRSLNVNELVIPLDACTCELFNNGKLTLILLFFPTPIFLERNLRSPKDLRVKFLAKENYIKLCR